MKIAASLLGAALLSLSLSAHASAGGVSATLGVTYYEVPDGVDPDFPGGFPVVADGSSLGPNGLPVATGGVSDLDKYGEITWWSPALNSNVTETGTGTVTLPYASNMYAPGSTGTNDATYFETAVLTGQFSLSAPSTVSFELGSDDDSFIYVDGTLIGQNPGIHSVTDVDFTSGTLSSGSHDIEVFYADREQSGAYLSLSLNSTGVIITPISSAPEPTTWVLMIAGLGGVGLMLRRARKAIGFRPTDAVGA